MGSLCHRGGGRHAGYILVELLLVVVLLSVSLGFVGLSYDRWLEEHRLEMATMELSAAIREAQILARSGGKYGSTGNMGPVMFSCEDGPDGRVHYQLGQNANKVEPPGVLPEGVFVANGAAFVVFYKNRFAAKDKDSVIVLYTKKRRFVRRITIAMYTKRVRVTSR